MKKTQYIVSFLLLALLSCEDDSLLFETDISAQNVILLAPTDSAIVASNLVQFDWRLLEDATNYELQVAKPNFQEAEQLLINTILDSSNTFNAELPVGQYAWRVKALNSGYETAYTTAKFDVILLENFSDAIVVLTSPEDGLITNTAIQQLSWLPIEGALLYRIQTLMEGVVIDEFTSLNSETEYIFPEGDIAWQVRGENGTENTVYSSRNLLTDFINPNAPVLSSPQNEEVLAVQDVSFNWTRESIEGSVEYDEIAVYSDVDLTDLVFQNEATSPFESVLEKGTYYWFVKAFDEAGNESEESKVFSFTINL